MPANVARLVDAHAWRQAHAAATPALRLTTAMLARPDIEAWPRLLALAIASSDYPRREYARLCAILRMLHRCGLRVFDGEAARDAHAALPMRIEIHRGTCLAEHESREFGARCRACERALTLRERAFTLAPWSKLSNPLRLPLGWTALPT